MGRRLLRARVCGIAARRWQPGRPTRAQALLPDRPDGLRCRIDRRCPVRVGGPVDRVASGDGGGRGADDPRVVVDHQRRLPRPSAAGQSDRRVGRDDRARDRDRTDRRRLAAGQVLVGLDLPRQRPDCDRRVRGSDGASARLEEPGRRPSRSRGCRALDRRPGPVAVGDHRRSDQGLELGERGRSRSPQRRRARRLHRPGKPTPTIRC